MLFKSKKKYSAAEKKAGQLREWARTALKAGHSKADIERRLRLVGWTDDKIKSALPGISIPRISAPKFSIPRFSTPKVNYAKQKTNNKPINNRLTNNRQTNNQSLNNQITFKPDMTFLLAVILSASFFALAYFEPSILGAFAGPSNWEHRTELAISNGQRDVSYEVVFENYKPANCAEGIKIEKTANMQSSEVQFKTENEVYENGFCTKATAVWNNSEFGSTTEESTVYTVYSGAIETPATPAPIGESAAPEVSTAEQSKAEPSAPIEQIPAPSGALTAIAEVPQTLANGTQVIPETPAPMIKEINGFSASGGDLFSAQSLDPSELEYQHSVGPLFGSATPMYNYTTVFNPSGSGKTVLIKRLNLRVNAVAAATSPTNISLRRINAAAGGTLTPAADIPKKNTDSVDSILQIRYNGQTGIKYNGTEASKLNYVIGPLAAGALSGRETLDFGNSSDEKLVLQPGEGLVLYQDIAGDADWRIWLSMQWEEVTSTPAPQNKFIMVHPRVEAIAAANFNWSVFFNPAGSGKVALIDQVDIDIDCDTGAVYTTTADLRRCGPAITGTNSVSNSSNPAAPQLNTQSNLTVMDFRVSRGTTPATGSVACNYYNLSTVQNILSTQVCGAASEVSGEWALEFRKNDEKLILQPGEGIILRSSGVGDVDQIVRMGVRWKELDISSTPPAQNEYMWTGSVTGSTVVGYNYTTFFNPVDSGKRAVIKKFAMINDAVAAATYQAITIYKTNSAGGGTAINNGSIPKKNTASPNSVMDVRTAGPTGNRANGYTTNSRLFSINGPGAVGQLHSHQEIAFGDFENLVLLPGEGIIVTQEAAGDADQRIKFYIEWQESASTPTALNEYMAATTQAGVATAGYNYSTLFNPSTSGTNVIVKRVLVMADAAAAAVYVPITLRRITGIQGGTQINNGAIPKKNNGSVNSKANVTFGLHNVTLAGATNSRLLTLTTPGAVGSAVAPQLTAHKEIVFSDDDPLVLRPGEGISLYQEAAGSTGNRFAVYYEWQENAVAPTSNGDYMIYIGPINGNLSANFAYATIFNPLNSTKNYLVKRMDERAARTGTATAPAYLNISIRRIMGASNGGGGTLFNGAAIPKKDTNTGASTAEVRMGNVTIVLNGTTNHRILGLTAPGAVGQEYGRYETLQMPEDLFLLKPGEGLVMYQETPAAGDVNVKYKFGLVWNESGKPDATRPQWNGPYVNSSTILQNDWAKFSTNWTDDVGLSHYIFSINQSTGWVNSSAVSFNNYANGTSVNVSQITASYNTIVYWRFYANDSNGKWNETNVQNFTVRTNNPLIIRETPAVVGTSQTFGQRLILRNSAGALLPNVQLNETLPSGTTFVACSPSSNCSYDSVNKVINWNVGNMPASGNGVYVYANYTVTAGSADMTFNALANCDLCSNVQDSKTVSADPGPVARYAVDLDPAVRENNNATSKVFKFIVKNVGTNAISQADGANFTIYVNNSYTSVTSACEVTGGTTVNWTVACPLASLASGATTQFNFTATTPSQLMSFTGLIGTNGTANYPQLEAVTNRNFTGGDKTNWTNYKEVDASNVAAGQVLIIGGMPVDRGVWRFNVTDASTSLSYTVQGNLTSNGSGWTLGTPTAAYLVYEHKMSWVTSAPTSNTMNVVLVKPDGSTVILDTMSSTINATSFSFRSASIPVANFSQSGVYNLTLQNDVVTPAATASRVENWWDDVSLILVKNVTDVQNFFTKTVEGAVVDTTPTQWTNQSQSSNTVTMFGQVVLSAYGLDVVNLTQAWLATNETGVWVNWTGSLSGPYQSPINITSGQVNTWNQTNFTWGNSSIQGSTNISWKIYYNDSSGNINETAEMSFVMSDAIGLTAMVGTIEFGTLIQGATNDTVTGGPMPFSFRNTGNINLNVTVAATNLFGSAPNPAVYFQFKSVDNETSSTLNAADLMAVFTNMYAAANKFAYNFKWQDENDEIRGHINMSAPPAEPAGSKTSEVTFTGSKA